MRRLLFVFALLFGAAAVHAQPINIRVGFAFNPEGRAWAISNFGSEQAWINWQMAGVTGTNTPGGSAFDRSGLGNITITDAGYITNVYTGGPFLNSVEEVVSWVSPELLDARVNLDVDIMVIVSDYDDDMSMDNPLGGYSDEICNKRGAATIAINASTAIALALAHEIGHQMCGEHSKGHSGGYGSSQLDCEVWFTAMANTVAEYLVPTDTWTVNQSNLQSNVPGQDIVGHGPSPDSAYSDMAGRCHLADWPSGYYTYTCASEGACTMQAGGSAATCPHSWTQTQNAGCSVGCIFISSGLTAWGSKTTTYSQCMNIVRIPYFSNPAISYHGMPTGTTEKNNALAMAVGAATIATFRTKNVQYRDSIKFLPVTTQNRIQQ